MTKIRPTTTLTIDSAIKDLIADYTKANNKRPTALFIGPTQMVHLQNYMFNTHGITIFNNQPVALFGLDVYPMKVEGLYAAQIAPLKPLP